MLEKFKKNALTNEQMKSVKGGRDYYYTCKCMNGRGGFQGYGTVADIGDANNANCEGSGASCVLT